MSLRVLLRSLCCIAVALAIAYGIHLTPLGASLDRSIYDRVSFTDPVPYIAIIAIDDASLQQVGAWPWDRSVFATFVERTKSASIVAFDILFLEPRGGDDVLRASLEKDDQTSYVMAAKLGSSSIFTNKSEKIYDGIVHVYPDDDGVVRRVLPQGGPECADSFIYTVARFYHREIDIPCVHAGQSFLHPSRFTTYSFKDVYNGTISKEELQSKILLVGVTSLDMGDIFIGANGNKVPGVSVLASQLQALMQDKLITDMPHGVTFVVLVLSSCLVIGLTRMRSLWGQIISSGCMITLLVVGGVLSLDFGYRPTFDLIILVPLLTFIYCTIEKYITTEKTNEDIKKLFTAYVHPHILQKLTHQGATFSLEGEKRRITVLFSDIRNFTAYSEHLDPKTLVQTMNDYFSAMTPAITDEYGTIDKYIGDAIMAFWNAPTDVDNHEARAVRAALSMQDRLLAYNKATGKTFHIGIGIHTGEAVIGNVGSKERINYTAVGDTVNVASRVEGLTKDYSVGILITEDVMKHVSHDIDITCTPCGTTSIRGRKAPVALYSVTRTL